MKGHALIALSYRNDVALAFYACTGSNQNLPASHPLGGPIDIRRRGSATLSKGDTHMRALVIAITALATVSMANDALAQRSMKEMMDQMKAKYPRSFAACQSLAASRGYRLSDNEYEGRQVMMFIEGCIMGRQR
jgi:hypothetical protein